MNIQGRVFLVTGGASGLGLACVERLAGNGAKVVIVDLSPEKGEAVAARFAKGTVIFAQADITDEVQIQGAVDLARSRMGALHGVICCAGIGVAEKVVSKDGKPHGLASFSKVIEVNLIGTFNVLRLVAASLAKQTPDEGGERGVLITTASIAAFEGQWGQAAYAASKGGLVALTLPMARELAPLGIRVMTIAPGIFDTPMLAGVPEAARVSLGQQVPFPSRLGLPEEFAQLVQQILENRMLNGTVIRLDGALRMGPR